jgi:hypothetical protein
MPEVWNPNLRMHRHRHSHPQTTNVLTKTVSSGPNGVCPLGHTWCIANSGGQGIYEFQYGDSFTTFNYPEWNIRTSVGHYHYYDQITLNGSNLEGYESGGMCPAGHANCKATDSWQYFFNLVSFTYTQVKLGPSNAVGEGAYFWNLRFHNHVHSLYTLLTIDQGANLMTLETCLAGHANCAGSRFIGRIFTWEELSGTDFMPR